MADIVGQLAEVISDGDKYGVRAKHPISIHIRNLVENALREIERLRTVSGEPVAWRARHADGDWVLLHTRLAADEYAKQPDTIVEPLYAAKASPPSDLQAIAGEMMRALSRVADFIKEWDSTDNEHATIGWWYPEFQAEWEHLNATLERAREAGILKEESDG